MRDAPLERLTCGEDTMLDRLARVVAQCPERGAFGAVALDEFPASGKVLVPSVVLADLVAVAASAWMRSRPASLVRDLPFDETAAALGLRTIETAPRDGTAIYVTAEGEPMRRMSWNQFGSNPLVQAERGIWWGEKGGYTWSEKDGFGPTHWVPTDHIIVQHLEAARC
ncbi:hypothetical protein [Brevundimonas diminuta]|uniref:hypothetical protein n=1 Tax=Brevundimonas diminuta TaxID=293 RepID=UPI003F820DAE